MPKTTHKIINIYLASCRSVSNIAECNDNDI